MVLQDESYLFKSGNTNSKITDIHLFWYSKHETIIHPLLLLLTSFCVLVK